MDQHRGVVIARNGVVAASQPLAVSAGLGILQQGGSFADAAIAVSAVLCVVEPYASHLGGDAFVVLFDAQSGKTAALNGSGAAPESADLHQFRSGIPLRGLSAASVPGLVHAWSTLHARWGKFPFSALLEPAISYAAHGFPAGERYCRRFAENTALFDSFPETRAALLPLGRLPSAGETIVQPDLAWTLSRIAEAGSSAFYSGEITERILRYSQASGGHFSAADFARHQTEVLAPIETTYRDYTVYGQPPVSQGHILLQMLNLLEGYDLADMGHNSAAAIHTQVEAKKLAFADRAAYLGDPSFVSMPLEQLLSKEYAAERRDRIDPQHAALQPPPGTIDHDTTYFCIADSTGSGISFIQSVFWGFGSGAVAPGTGVLFNNRMTGFSLDPSSPNVLAPGKRTAHTLNAWLLTRGPASQAEAPSSVSPVPAEQLAFVGGTPGGDVQVQSNAQMICNAVDFGLNPQQTVEAPRWQHGGSVGASDEPGADILAIEDRVPADVRSELEHRGHRVEPLGPWSHSSACQFIAVHPDTGAYMAGSDPRCDGQAAGY